MSIVKVVGIPSSAGCRSETSTAIDQHNGPASIRSAFNALTRNFKIPIGFDDLGDIRGGNSVPELLNDTESRVSSILAEGSIPCLLGGVHTLTLGALRAVAKANSDFSLIYIDAHADLMPHAQINYGSLLFYALKEEVLDPARTALLGLRQVEEPEYELINEHKIFHMHALEFEKTSAKQIVKQIKEEFRGPYYLSIDLDSIDPAHAPGVTLPYPGGLTSREVLYIANEICKLGVVGLDIVEHAPINDRGEETARLAANLLLTLSNTISERTRRH